MHTISLIFTDLSFCENVNVDSDDCIKDTRDESNDLNHIDEKCTEKKKNSGFNFKIALRKLI